MTVKNIIEFSKNYVSVIRTALRMVIFILKITRLIKDTISLPRTILLLKDYVFFSKLHKLKSYVVTSK